MKLHKIVRTLFYSVTTIIILAVAVSGLTIYKRGIHVPDAMLNAGLAKRIALRYGVQYSVKSLRIGCLGQNCPGDVNTGSLQIEIQIPEPLRVQWNETNWSRGNPVTIRGLEVRSGSRPMWVGIDSVESDLFTRRATAKGLHFGTASREWTVDSVEFDETSKQISARGIRSPSVVMNSVRLEGWSATPSNSIALKHLEIDGIQMSPPQEAPTTASICEQLPSRAELGGDAMGPLRPLLPLLLKDVALLHGDLLRIAIAIGITIFIFKLLTVLWLRSGLFLLLAAITAVLPFVLYFQFRVTLLVGTLIIAVMAILLRVFVYRRGERWYQRWEPFVVDVASVAVLLPLLGYGFELPPLPDPPTSVQLDQIEVAGVAVGAGVPNAPVFRIPQTSIRDVRVEFPGANPDIDIAVTSIQIPRTDIAAPPSSQVTVNGIEIDNVHFAYDPDRREVLDIAARMRLSGLFESDALARELRSIEYLRGIDARSRVGFDLDVHASGPQRPPDVSTKFPLSKSLIAANAAVRLSPSDCTLSFDVASRIQTQPLTMSLRADGDTRGIQIRSLRSLPESPIQVASGHGAVKWRVAPEVNIELASVGGTFGSTRLDVSSIALSASAPPPGKAGIQAAAITVGPSTIHPNSGWNIRAARSSFHFDRMPDERSVPVTFDTRIDDVQIEGPGGLIEANLPVLVSRLSGQTTAEIIPHRFDGTIDFFATGNDPSDELLSTGRPIAVSADLWQGLLHVPEQAIAVRSSIFSGSPTEIPVQLKLSGRLSSVVPEPNAGIETQMEVLHFEPVLGSARLAVDDVRVSARMDWDDSGATADMSYGIGSTRVALSPGPTAVCLDQITALNVTASGTISRIIESGGLLPSLVRAPSPCVSLPAAPESIQFQLSGSFPPSPQESLIRLARPDGTGIRIQNVDTTVRALQIRDGRLVSVESDATISGIQNLQGAGSIEIQGNFRQTKDSFQLTSRLSALDGTEWLNAAFVSTPSTLSLDAVQLLPADQVLAEIRPFLSDLDLGNVNPQARLTQLHADANFENGGLLNAAIVARLDRGALASIESPEFHSNISTLSSAASDPFLSLHITPASEPGGARQVIASLGVSGASVHAVTDKDVVMDIAADLSILAQGTILMSGQPKASPVIERIVDVGSELSRQAALLSELLDSGAVRPFTDNFHWNVRLSQNSQSNAFLRLDPDALELHIADAAVDAAWDGIASQEQSRIGVSASLDSRISLEENATLVDVVSPIVLRYAVNGQPETRIDSNIPLQLAFSPKLIDAPVNSDALWNQDYYTQFWRAHPSRFSAGAFASPIDFNEVTLGPLSIRELRFPLEPLRILVGYSEALEVALPFSGRLLYGGVSGNIESRIATSNGMAVLDTRLNLDLKNIQAGGIGSTVNGEHAAFIEDELGGPIALRVDGLRMNRTTLPALFGGRLSSEDLESLGLSVHLHRSDETANLPGVLQASSEVQINLVNELLNQVVKDLHLPAPPRALTYRYLAVDFDVERGRVRTDKEVFRLSGVQLFSSDSADVHAEIRAHLGRLGERIMLGSLMEMIGGLGGN